MFFSDIKIPHTYYLVDNPKKLGWLSQELMQASEFAFDIETNHPTWKKKKKLPDDFIHKVCGISFGWGRNEVQVPWQPGNAAYVPLRKSDDSCYWGERQSFVETELKQILESNIPKIAHNGKFDVRVLANLMEICVRNLVFDTMLAHALLDEDRLVCSHALKSDFGLDGKVIKLGCSDAYLQTEASLFKDDLQ